MDRFGSNPRTPQKVAESVPDQAIHTVRGEHTQGVPEGIGGLDVLAHYLAQGIAEFCSIAAQTPGNGFASWHTGYT
ncbi:hypothetical protein D3C84_1277720 [compost metagenome]